MTTFYCVRHGKTIFNQNHTFQGGIADSPLLPEGEAAAELVGTFLKDVPFTTVLVSPQKRAQDTAKRLLKNHSSPLEIETIQDLREMEFGIWDGLPEANFHHEAEFQHLVHRPHLYNPTAIGGESFQVLIDRGKTVFMEAAQKDPEGHILIVSHGLFLQTLLKTFQGIPLSDVRKGDFLDNTSVTTVVSDVTGTEFTIEKWNDTSFV